MSDQDSIGGHSQPDLLLRVEQMSVVQRELTARIDRLESLLYGENGDGLRGRMIRLEEQIHSLQKELQSTRQEIISKHESQLRWAIAIVGTLATLITNILTHLIFR